MPAGTSTDYNPRYPMTMFPKGWYAIGYGDEFPGGEVKPLEALGRPLVAAHGAKGRVQVFDAYCPHLGAHLGYGGRVVGDSIRCPFHHWEFSASDGKCSRIPYAKRIPPSAELAPWPTDEVNGMVFIYFDPEGKPPEWRVEPFDELRDDSGWVEFARKDWALPIHIQDALENVFDTAHITYLHQGGEGDVMPVTSLSERQGVIEWKADDPAGAFSLVGKCWGLGTVALHYPIEVPIVEYDTFTPLDTERLLMRTRLLVKDTGDPALNETVGNAVRDELYRQIEADVVIFEHKLYRPNPVLCDGDGPVGRYRSWAKQFYNPGDAP